MKHLKSIAEMSTKLVKKQLNGVLTEIFKPLEELEVESAKKNAKSITKSQKKKLESVELTIQGVNRASVEDLIQI